MAREPQRREQAAPLGAAIIPVERALRARAKALEAEVDKIIAMGEGYLGVENPVTLRRIATEFRSLAEELSHW